MGMCMSCFKNKNKIKDREIYGYYWSFIKEEALGETNYYEK